MAKDINKEVFPEETLLKLDIFAKCFREWFPVFVNDLYTKKIIVIDFFAGRGKDANEKFGSPLLLLNEVQGKHCDIISKNGKEVILAFNEIDKPKCSELKTNIESFMAQCLQNCKREKCVYNYENFYSSDFKKMFYLNTAIKRILADRDCAKFILLDQYGFKQVDENIFQRLVDSPRTDFIFFISSSFIKRFKEEDSTKKYINTENIPFESDPQECHKLIADYFRNLVPQDKEYYIHHFTIKNGANYWGLIFGTNHSLGMEKFLRVCWKEDVYSGESNFNINNDYEKDSLFYTGETNNKKENIKNDLKTKILSGEISNNIIGLKYALKKGCLPDVFVSVVQELVKEQLIDCQPKMNRQTANIHKALTYYIEVLKK